MISDDKWQCKVFISYSHLLGISILTNKKGGKHVVTW